MKPRVYVPQEPCRYDGLSGLWIPKINLLPARQHGELVIMIPPQASRLDLEPQLQRIRDCMVGFTEFDWLVAVGDPTLMSAAASIATRNTDGLLRMLKWDRQTSTYIPVEIQL